MAADQSLPAQKVQKSTTAIVPYNQQKAANAMAVVKKITDPVAYAKAMGQSAATFCNVPSIMGEQIAMICLMEGISILDFIRKYHFIQGKPTIKSTAMLSEFRMNQGGSYKIIRSDHTVAEITFTDRYGNVHEEKLTRMDLMLSRWPWVSTKTTDWKTCTSAVRQQIKEGVPEEKIFEKMTPCFKDNYGTELDWRSMLVARLTSEAMKKICPEMAAGIYTPEEVQDVIDATYTTIVLPQAPSAAEVVGIAPATAEVVAAGDSEPPTLVVDDSEVEFIPSELESQQPATEPPTEEAPFETEREMDFDKAELVNEVADLFQQAFGQGLAEQKISESCRSRGVANLNDLPVAGDIGLNTMKTRLKEVVASKSKN